VRGLLKTGWILPRGGGERNSSLSPSSGDLGHALARIRAGPNITEGNTYTHLHILLR
jgi:hypothetical protein